MKFEVHETRPDFKTLRGAQGNVQMNAAWKALEGGDTISFESESKKDLQGSTQMRSVFNSLVHRARAKNGGTVVRTAWEDNRRYFWLGPKKAKGL